MILIGYSGHALVAIEAIYSCSGSITGYCEIVKKKENPFDLKYLGFDSVDVLTNNQWIVAIGDNKIRSRIIEKYKSVGALQTISHSSSIIASFVEIGIGTLLCAGSIVNSLAVVGKGCIIKTAAVVEHGCQVGDFVHVAPGAVLAGNVKVGKHSFIGANAVVRQGVEIGNDVIVGAGAVVLSDVPDGKTVVGNPAKIIKRKQINI